eukprot:5908342-Prymnesium_polylepis.1
MQQARMNEALSAPRIASFVPRREVQSEVGPEGREPTPCKGGCGRTLHMVECGSFGSARAASTRLLCAYCHVGEMHPGAVDATCTAFPSESMMRWSMQTAEHDQRGAHGRRDDGGGLRGHRSAREAVGGGVGRERHGLPAPQSGEVQELLDLAVYGRGAGAFGRRAVATVQRADKGAEQHDKGLLKKSGVSHEAKASCTSMMLHALVEGDGHGGIAQQHRPHELVGARDALLYGIGGLGGPRIGEQADCGQGHGVVCSDVVLYETPDGREVVELQIRAAKTGFARYTPIARTTRSGVKALHATRPSLAPRVRA